MPAPHLDLSWVAPRLAIGAAFDAEAAALLARAHRIGHVVDLRVEACDDERVLRRAGVALLHLPTEDTCGIAVERLDHGVAWVRAAQARGGAVLVHCQHGIGRSALLALCVLVASGEPPLAALARAKAARPVVSPSPPQLEAFRAWLAARGGVEVPAFEGLAAIAYAHLHRPAEEGCGA